MTEANISKMFEMTQNILCSPMMTHINKANSLYHFGNVSLTEEMMKIPMPMMMPMVYLIPSGSSDHFQFHMLVPRGSVQQNLTKSNETETGKDKLNQL